MRGYLSPYQANELLQEQYGQRLQAVRPDLRYWLMASVLRVVDDGGITINGLRFQGRVLDPIRGTLSPATRTRKWRVHYDWNDLRFSYVNRSQGLRVKPDWVAVPWVDAPKALAVPFPEALRLFLRRHEARLDAAGTPIDWQVPRELRGRVQLDESKAIGARMQQFVRYLADLELHRHARGFKDTETAAVVLALIEAARATVRWYPAQEAWRAAQSDPDPESERETPTAPAPVSVRRRPIRGRNGLPRKLI